MAGMRSLLLRSLVCGPALLVAGCGSSASSSSTAGPPNANPGGGSVVVAGQTVAIAQSTQPRNAASSVPATTLSAAAAANNAFATDLFGQVRVASASENLLTSPISASLALTMTLAGARGTTATQMASVLHTTSMGAGVFDGQNGLTQALAALGPAALAEGTQLAKENSQPAPSADDYQLQVVNSVWGERAIAWATPFLDTLATDYGTGVYLEDFAGAPDPARVLINDWVTTETVSRINNLLPPGSVTSFTKMVLVNAVHLKFPWATPFTASATQPSSFTTASGTSVTAPFMNRTDTLSYVDDGAAQIVALPLVGGVSVVIALPHGDLASYEASLTPTSAALSVPSASELVQLSLPKVSFTSPSLSFAKPLQTLGMNDAFSGTADFSGLTANPADARGLHIDDVLQKAMVAMQETGVEAAAATAVLISGAAIGTGGPPPPPIPMVVDRPYLLSIVDPQTGAVLFLGHIVDPTQAGGG